MMERIKALVKVELKPAILMSIYFLVIHIGGLLFAGISINKAFENYLRYDYAPHDINGDIILSLMPAVLMLVFLGMLILVYFQFKYDKSVEIGRFLKALPYTNIQRCLVKITAGILSFSVPFIVFAIGLMALRSYAINLFRDAYKVLPYEEVIYIINHSEHLLQLIVLSYLVYCAVYLFLFMMQYLMNNNIGSLVTGVLILGSPLFVALSAFEIYSLTYGEFNAEILLLPVYGMVSDWNQLMFESQIPAQAQYLNYSYIALIEYKIFIAALASGLFSIIICLASKRNKIEDADMLIPNRTNRWIFIMGVTLCSGFLLADIGQFLILPLIMNNVFAMGQVMLVAGAAVGFFIAKKIASIGVSHKKNKRLRKILPLMLLGIFMTGCSDIKEEAKTYKPVSYDNAYYVKDNISLEPLRKEIEKFDRSKENDWGINEYGDTQLTITFYKQSKISRAIIKTIEEYVVGELEEVVEEMSAKKEEVASEERLFGDYGIVCTKDHSNIIIKIIKNDIQITDPSTQEAVAQIITPDFMITNFQAGAQHHMIKLATPMAVGYQSRNYMSANNLAIASSYQIFRDKSGKITKVRWIINTFDRENNQEENIKELVAKHLIPLQNAIDYIGTQETPIEAMIADVKKVYVNHQIKASGKINAINYRIQRHSSRNDYFGELIEVVVEANE